MPYNPQAYPCLDSSGDGLYMRDPGMTLRDWFAGQALSRLMLKDPWGDPCMLSNYAYNAADAMLAEKETRDAS